jgi:hypothetical protein
MEVRLCMMYVDAMCVVDLVMNVRLALMVRLK